MATPSGLYVYIVKICKDIHFHVMKVICSTASSHGITNTCTTKRLPVMKMCSEDMCIKSSRKWWGW